MSTTTDPNDRSNQREAIRQVAEEFAERLRAGDQPNLEEYVERIDSTLQEKVREELVGEEFAHRFGDATQEGTLRYRPTAVLGKGAFGEVYKAFDEELQRNVAIKVLLETDESARKRFLEEARRQANLPKHNHLVPVYHSGALPEGHPFVVLEYVEGKSLREALGSDGKHDAEAAAQLMEKVALAVAIVHQSTSGSRKHPTPALVHRDSSQRTFCSTARAFLMSLTLDSRLR